MKIKNLTNFIPFFWECDALALYMEINMSDQLDIKKIESRLKESFVQDMFNAL